MGNIKIKQTLNLSTELSLKASQIELTAASARLEALLDAVHQDRVTGETYLKYKTNATSTNTVEFPASINWKEGFNDIEVYVNSIRISNSNFTYTAGTGGSGDTIVFNANLIGYEIDTNDIIEVVGVIFAVVLGYPTVQRTGEPYTSIPTEVLSFPYKEFSAGTSDNIYAIAVDANDNVFMGGIFTSYDGTTANRIVKVNPNGDIDTNFITGTGFDNRPWSIKIGEESGNLLVAGQFTTYNGVACRAFVALDAETGDLIQHYNAGSITGYVLEEFGDGTVMAGGTAGVCRRYSIAGVQDNTFSFSTGTNPVRSIAKFKDGSNKYLISRQTGIPGLVITNESGTIDSAATSNMNVTQGFAESWAYGPNNKIIIGTGTMRYGGYATPTMIVDSNGNFDATFAENASKFTVSQTVEVLYRDEKIILTGTTSQGGEYPYNVSADYHVFDLQGNYLSADGLFDFNQFIWAGDLTTEGNLLVGGSLRQAPLLLNFQPVASGVYQTEVSTTSWTINSEQYDFQSGFVGTIYTIEKYKDKLLVGGDLESYNGVSIKSNLVRLNNDGTLDYTFAPTNITGKVNKIKWIIGTDVVLAGGDFTGYLKAYNENGSENLNWTTLFNGEVRAIYHDRYKKKVVVGGAFTGGLKVFSEYGVLDTSFNIGTGFNGRVNDIFWENQRSSRMLVIGNFTECNGAVVNIPKITLLNSDGSLNTSTITGTGFNGEPYCLFPNSSITQVFIGGSFSSYNGNAAGNFAYVSITTLESDAVGEPVNNAFTRPNQFNGPVYQIGYLNNRTGISTYNINYVVVGDFTSYIVGEPGYGMKTITATGIGRIGSGYWDIPSDWQEGISTNGPVYAVESQFMNGIPGNTTHNNWIIGGDFTQYDGISAGNICQVSTAGPKLN